MTSILDRRVFISLKVCKVWFQRIEKYIFWWHEQDWRLRLKDAFVWDLIVSPPFSLKHAFSNLLKMILSSIFNILVLISKPKCIRLICWIFHFLLHLLKGFQSLSCESCSNTRWRVGILHYSSGSSDPSYIVKLGSRFISCTFPVHSIQIIFIYSYSNIKDWTFLQITSNHYCNIQPCPIGLDIQDEIQDDTQDGIKEIVERMSMVILWFYLVI